MAVIGIDFGTSYTLVVKKEKGQDPELLAQRLCSFSAGAVSAGCLANVKGIRTVIGYTNNGEWVIGKDVFDARDDGNIRNENICWNLKTLLRKIAEHKNLSDAEQINKGIIWKDLKNIPKNKDYGLIYKGTDGKDLFCNAIELANIFFEKLFLNVLDGELYDVECVVIGAPGTYFKDTMCSIEYQNIMRDLLRHLNGYKIGGNLLFGKELEEKNLRVRPEPLLAGQAFFKFFRPYIDDKIMRNNNMLLVIDIGGGTSDFTLLGKRGSKIYAPVESQGNISIAGDSIDYRIEEGLKADNGLSEAHLFFHEDIIAAKENLFYGRMSDKISYLANENRIDAEDIYKKYSECGRRAKIKDVKGQEYCLAYSEEHTKGIAKDGWGDWSAIARDRIYFIADSLKILAESLAKAVCQFMGNRHYKADSVLFVGGTSQIEDLCNIVTDALVSEGYLKNKTAVFNLEIASGFGDNARMLSYANMVAVGAAYAAEDDGDELFSVPELYIKQKGRDEMVLILSQDIKNANFTPEIATKWPYILCNVNPETTIRFKIVEKLADGKLVYFPRNNYYSFTVNTVNGDKTKHDVMFFADCSGNGEVALFVSLLDRANEGERSVSGYKYAVNTNKPGVRDVINNHLSAQVSGIRGFAKYKQCIQNKKYSLVVVGQDKENFVGKEYSIFMHADKDGFGWETGKNNR